jgi:colicin import membrane protein
MREARGPALEIRAIPPPPVAPAPAPPEFELTRVSPYAEPPRRLNARAGWSLSVAVSLCVHAGALALLLLAPAPEPTLEDAGSIPIEIIVEARSPDASSASGGAKSIETPTPPLKAPFTEADETPPLPVERDSASPSAAPAPETGPAPPPPSPPLEKVEAAAEPPAPREESSLIAENEPPPLPVVEPPLRSADTTPTLTQPALATPEPNAPSRQTPPAEAPPAAEEQTPPLPAVEPPSRPADAIATPAPTRLPQATPAPDTPSPQTPSLEGRSVAEDEPPSLPPPREQTFGASPPAMPKATPPSARRPTRFSASAKPARLKEPAAVQRFAATPENAETPAARASSAPERSAATGSASAPSANADAYRSEIVARISAAKHYPEDARSRGASGVAVVAFSIDASGALGGASIRRSSGDAGLDGEAVATVRRASPFPPPPPGAPRAFSIGLNYRLP